MTAPAFNAENVSIKTKIILNFSTQVSNVNTQTVLLNDCGTNPSTISIEKGATDTEFVITPQTNLLHKTKYCVNLTSDIIDNLKTHLIQNKFWFTTGDKIIPTVSLTSKPTDASVTGPISLKFSSAMKANTGLVEDHIVLRKLPDKEKIDMNVLEVTGNTVFSFTPKSPMAYGASYYLDIDANITDIDGNQFPGGALNFSTVNSKKITAQITSAKSGIDANHASASIQLSYGNFDINDFSKDDVTLTKEGSSSPITFNFTSRIVNMQFVYDITPAASLESSTKYNIAVKGKVLSKDFELLPASFIIETAAAKRVDISLDSWNSGYAPDPLTLVLFLHSKDPDLVNDPKFITSNFIVTERYDHSKEIPSEDLNVTIMADEEVPDYMRKYIWVKILISRTHLISGLSYTVKTNGKTSEKNYQLDPNYEYWFVGQ